MLDCLWRRARRPFRAAASVSTLPDRRAARDRTTAQDKAYTILLALSRPLLMIVATGSHKIVYGQQTHYVCWSPVWHHRQR